MPSFLSDIQEMDLQVSSDKWAATWQNQRSECAPSEDSDQPRHLPSLIRVFTVSMEKPWALSYPLSAHFVGFVMLRLKYCSDPWFSDKEVWANSVDPDRTATLFAIAILPASFGCITNGPGHAKTCLMPYANNKGADQPPHPCRLISTFVVHCLGSMICILAISKSFKILASFCSWADWFEYYLVENSPRYIFAWCGSLNSKTTLFQI